MATLDPTTRRVRLPGGKEVLWSDTVGFIQKLPTKLVSSFRATLEELEDATILVHVVDASHPLAKQQIWSVQSIIEELMMEDTPQILVLNKMDAYQEVCAYQKIHEIKKKSTNEKKCKHSTKWTHTRCVHKSEYTR